MSVPPQASHPSADLRPRDDGDLEKFFAHALDLLCIAGLDGYFRRVSPSWTRTLGWTEEELLSRPVAEIMHPEDRERTLRARERLAQGIPVMGLENRYLCKGGGYRWLSWQSSIVGETGLVFAIARDITERRRSDQEHLVLSKLEAAGLLAGGIAHDFNNLLATLMLRLDLALLDEPMSSGLERQLRGAQETIRAAESLILQLTTFAQGAGGPRRVLDMTALLRDAAESALENSAVRVDCLVEPGLWPVEGEESSLRLLVRNLALNARDAMPGGGVARLIARNVTLAEGQVPNTREGDYVQFTLRDEGAGIPPDLQLKLFDPYFSTKERGPRKGMGLGLTLCHAIVREHGGQISVASSPGAGTAVSCYLPAMPGAVPAREAEVPVSGAKRRVLVMDDEPRLREMLARILDQLGCSAEFARDGEEALVMHRAARKDGRPYALVLLDHVIRGGMGGREVAALLRAEERDLRAVLMTGEEPGAWRGGGLDPEFRATIRKPLTMEGLRDALARASRD